MPGGGAYPPVGNGGGSFGSTASTRARQSLFLSLWSSVVGSIHRSIASHRALDRARTHHPPVTRQTTSSASSVSVPTVPETCFARVRRGIHRDVHPDRRLRNPDDRDGRLGTEAAIASRGDLAGRRGNRAGRRGSRAGRGLVRTTCRRGRGRGAVWREGWLGGANTNALKRRGTTANDRSSDRAV